VYKVTIAGVAELTEEVTKVEIDYMLLQDKESSKSLLSSMVQGIITVTGQILCDSDKSFMLSSTKAIADWSVLKPGHSDVYKNVTVEVTLSGLTEKLEFSDVFVVSYHEQLGTESSYFKLVLKTVQLADTSASGSAPSLSAGSAASKAAEETASTPTINTVADELNAIGPLTGKDTATINADMAARGYFSKTANSGGLVWSKDMPDGNTVVIRTDPAQVRTPPRAWADEVAHAHKESVPTTYMSAGDYSTGAPVTKYSDSNMASTDINSVHIPLRS